MWFVSLISSVFMTFASCSGGGGGGDGGGGGGGGAPGGGGTSAPEACAAPTFSISEGTYSADQNVVISTTTTGATIHYTTNGDAPTTSSPTYSAPIGVAGNGTVTTIKAIAVKDGMSTSAISSATYTINYSQVSTPQLSPVAGTYSSAQTVTITCGTDGATMRYTTGDGDTPSSSNGTIIASGGTISVSANTTVRALAYKSGMTDSTIAEAVYKIRTATPTFVPAGGIKSENTSVTIDKGSADDVYYTMTTGTVASPPADPADPTKFSTQYTGTITVSGHNTVAKIKAIAVKSDMENSNVASATYTINYAQVATPTFDKAAGWHTSYQNVTITCTTPGVTIRYTTGDGETPTSSFGTIITSGGTVALQDTTTLRAIAYKSGMLDSEVREAAYYIRRVIVVGSSYNGSNKDWMIQVLDTKGNVDPAWNKTIDFGGIDEARSAVSDSQGNVYVAGYANMNMGTFFGDGVIKKLSPSGVEVVDGSWPKTFSGKACTDRQMKLAIDPSSNIYTVHWEEKNWNGWMVGSSKVIKYAPNGSETWSVVINSAQQLGFPDTDRRPEMAFDVCYDVSSNSLFLAGQSVNWSKPEPEKARMFITSLSCANGALRSGWPVISPNPSGYNYSQGRNMAFAVEGSDTYVYVNSRLWNEPMGQNSEWSWIKKYRTDGTEITTGWDKILSDDGWAFAYIQTDNIGRVYITNNAYQSDGTYIAEQFFTGGQSMNVRGSGIGTNQYYIGHHDDDGDDCDWKIDVFTYDGSHLWGKVVEAGNDGDPSKRGSAWNIWFFWN